MNNTANDGRTNRAGIRFEVACGILDTLIGAKVADEATESAQPNPNVKRIECLRAEKAELRDRRAALDPDDPEAIELAIRTYGPRVAAMQTTGTA